MCTYSPSPAAYAHTTSLEPCLRLDARLWSPAPHASPHPCRRGTAIVTLWPELRRTPDRMELFWNGCLFSSIACWACCRLWAFWWPSYYRGTQGIGMFHGFCLEAEALVGHVDSVRWIANILYYFWSTTPHAR